jgi:hypothetical protein
MNDILFSGDSLCRADDEKLAARERDTYTSLIECAYS